MNHGLSQQTVAALRDVFARFPAIERAVLYGSRAKRNHRKGSDIDLTLVGAEMSERLLSKIYWELDDLDLPYKIDLSLFSELRHRKLIDHIKRFGMPIYERTTKPAQTATS
jgi:predicted nucleotidyltransferase